MRGVREDMSLSGGTKATGRNAWSERRDVTVRRYKSHREECVE